VVESVRDQRGRAGAVGVRLVLYLLCGVAWVYAGFMAKGPLFGLAFGFIFLAVPTVLLLIRSSIERGRSA
jgi:hypothetical protein